VSFTDETGKRTGWNTGIVMRALEHVVLGEDRVEFVEGPWESMVPRMRMVNGIFGVPSAAGLGATLDMTAADRYRAR